MLSNTICTVFLTNQNDYRDISVNSENLSDHFSLPAPLTAHNTCNTFLRSYSDCIQELSTQRRDRYQERKEGKEKREIGSLAVSREETMVAMMTIRGFPSSLPEAEIKGLLETIGQVGGATSSSHNNCTCCIAHSPRCVDTSSPLASSPRHRCTALT